MFLCQQVWSYFQKTNDEFKFEASWIYFLTKWYLFNSVHYRKMRAFKNQNCDDTLCVFFTSVCKHLT